LKCLTAVQKKKNVSTLLYKECSSYSDGVYYITLPYDISVALGAGSMEGSPGISILLVNVRTMFYQKSDGHEVSI
jgi:hypothetical protein